VLDVLSLKNSYLTVCFNLWMTVDRGVVRTPWWCVAFACAEYLHESCYLVVCVDHSWWRGLEFLQSFGATGAGVVCNLQYVAATAW
jgi:hypothetical protein